MRPLHLLVLLFLSSLLLAEPIDREALVRRHSPVLRAVAPSSPLSVGNGGFVFNVDVTGLQTFQELHTREGMPLETLSRRIWHSAPNPEKFTLADASSPLLTAGREVSYPVREKTPAGQWLRMNPHLFPLGQIGFVDAAGQALKPEELSGIEQKLDLWAGQITSRFTWHGHEVTVLTVVDPNSDTLAIRARSSAFSDGSLRVLFSFPRGHDMAVKNTPPHDWSEPGSHLSTLKALTEGSSWDIERRRDDMSYQVHLWAGGRAGHVLSSPAPHRFVLQPRADSSELAFTARFYQAISLIPSRPVAPLNPTITLPSIEESTASLETAKDGDQVPSWKAKRKHKCIAPLGGIEQQTASHWESFWRRSAAVDFSGSRDPRASELERRVVLSRYLCAIQIGGGMPPQETGLTCNSWYGKHHTEMVWWHVAHFALWGEPAKVADTLAWFESVLPRARQTAAERGLRGARWSKMVGPDGRESPGGTSLIWWNQPHPIHLAELLWRADPRPETLERWRSLVFETAECMASMAYRDPATGRQKLGPPMWIAQELYDQKLSSNPTYELVQWTWSLETAQRWRERLGLPREASWDAVLKGLPTPTVDQGKYVSMESIPDTWTNAETRHDHPSFLMAYGMLPGPGIDRAIMHRTLLATLEQWRWEVKIWGWDYPMIAMSAARLGEPAAAVEILLRDSPNNRYLPNGHCPQRRDLGVYLPANGSLLAAVAMMAGGWDGAPATPAPGFPSDGSWTVRAEGFAPLP